MLRPAHLLLLVVLLLGVMGSLLGLQANHQHSQAAKALPLLHIVTAGLGLTDLCVATEARYTRHPAISDPTVPFMDHPGAIEHFPTGSFWTPPLRRYR